jgi:hypothetical protein
MHEFVSLRVVYSQFSDDFLGASKFRVYTHLIHKTHSCAIWRLSHIHIRLSLQSVRGIKATDFSNGTIAAKLKDFCYLSAEGGVIEHQTADVF